MKIGIAGTAVLLVALAGCRTAVVETGPSAQPAPPPPTADAIPAGTNLELQLNQTLNSGDSDVGDRFTATVTRPLIARNGQTVVPAGAVVSGVVTGVKDARRLGDQAAIRLHFDRIGINGKSYPFTANIVDADVRARDTARTGRDAAIGAAAGAALGAIIGGDLAAALIGGALGAGAGTIISLGLGDVEAELPAGSIMTVQTTQTVALR